MLEGSKKTSLKKRSHKIKPLIQVGKRGVTDNLISAVDKALFDHELIKIKFLNYKNEKKKLSNLIANKTKSELLDVIGNTAIFFRKSLKKTRKKFVK